MEDCTEALVEGNTEGLVLVTIAILVLDIGTIAVEVVEVCVEIIVEDEAVGSVIDDCNE